jgi:hypothetical protein
MGLSDKLTQASSYLRKLRLSLGPDSYSQHKRKRKYDRKQADYPRERAEDAAEREREKAERECEHEQRYKRKREGEQPPARRVTRSPARGLSSSRQLLQVTG